MGKKPILNPSMIDKINQLEKLVSIQQAARLQLARYLHDGPTQSIAALTLRINYLRRLIEKDPGSISDELLKLEDSARQITSEMRYVLYAIQPLVLETSGLTPALQTLADKVKDAFNSNLTIEIEESAVRNLDSLVQRAIFYIAEESIFNAVKLAQAGDIRLKLSHEADSIRLDIQDDGIVAQPGALKDSTTNPANKGTAQMHAWSDLLQAKISIDSVPGKGSHIQVLIPASPSS
jgi:signal transduction histidine kinase